MNASTIVALLFVIHLFRGKFEDSVFELFVFGDGSAMVTDVVSGLASEHIFQCDYSEVLRHYLCFASEVLEFSVFLLVLLYGLNDLGVVDWLGVNQPSSAIAEV